MKNRKAFAISALLVWILSVCPIALSHGQSQPEAAGSLQLQRLSDSTRTVRIPPGSKLKVLASDGNRYDGSLVRVTDTSFVVEKAEIPFSKVVKLKRDRTEGGKIAGIIGIILGSVGVVLGFLLGLLSVAMIETASGSNGCGQALAGFLLLILAIAIGAVGIVFFIIAAVAFAVGKAAGRSFKFPGKWRLRKGN